MFLKPFRVKTQTTVKGSDRKKLRSEIEHQYPSLTSAAVADLIPNKGDMTQVKLETHSDDHYLVYCIQKNPVFFEAFKKLYPTVYTLWKFPDILPVFTTYPPVFQKLLKGADLMLPGVEVKGDHHPKMFGNLQKGDLCTVRLKGNRAPILLGETLLSGEDMYMSAMKGKGVRTIHIFHDHMWEMGDKSIPPQIPDNDSSDDEDSDEMEDEEGRADDNQQSTNRDSEDMPQSLAQMSVGERTAEWAGGKGGENESGEGEEDGGCGAAVDDEEEEEEEEKEAGATGGETVSNPGPENMDELLHQCFKWAIKGRVSKSDLPLLTSSLIKGYMQPFCAPGVHLDVKKSTYKKFSKFLHQMESEGFIKLKEISKGVDAITEIDKSHRELRGLEIPEISTQGSEDAPSEAKFEPPVIKEVLCVTAAVLPLFAPKGYTKGSALTAPELRQLVTDYVKTETLQYADSKEQVLLDPILAALALTRSEGDKSHLTWNALFNRISDKCQPGCVIQLPGKEPVLKKGKIPPISFKVLQRGSKKKVTVVHNLESYGVEPRQFAQLIQRRIACSASALPSERQAAGMDVQVQGSQTDFIVGLLLETYQIPRKYIEGADNVKKPKRR